MSKAGNPFAHIDLYETSISQAKNGDIEVANGLVNVAAHKIRKGEVLPTSLAEWIASGLDALTSKNGDIQISLHLKRKKGERPPKNSREFRELVASSVHYSRMGRHKAENRDGDEGAYAVFAEIFGLAPNTVEKYYNEHIDSLLEAEHVQEEIKRTNQRTP